MSSRVRPIIHLLSTNNSNNSIIKYCTRIMRNSGECGCQGDPVLRPPASRPPIPPLPTSGRVWLAATIPCLRAADLRCKVERPAPVGASIRTAAAAVPAAITSSSTATRSRSSSSWRTAGSRSPGPRARSQPSQGTEVAVTLISAAVTTIMTLVIPTLLSEADHKNRGRPLPCRREIFREALWP